jgi:hypothetical protein
MRSPSTSATLAVSGLLVATFVAFAGYCMLLEQRARDIVNSLAIGSASDITVGSLRTTVGKLTDSSCLNERCSYDAVVDNRLLAKLHLANFTELRATFYFEHGSRISTFVEYRAAVDQGNSPVVHVQDDGRASKSWEGLFAVNPHGPRSKELWNGMLEFNASTREAQRTAAMSFNLHCLLPFQRCLDISDLMPRIWSRNSDGSIRCEFRTSGDAHNEWLHY